MASKLKPSQTALATPTDGFIIPHDAVRYLNDELPCSEDTAIIGHLRDALRLFEARAARQTIEKLAMPELVPACPVCHHVLCLHDHPERLVHEGRR